MPEAFPTHYTLRIHNHKRSNTHPDKWHWRSCYSTLWSQISGDLSYANLTDRSDLAITQITRDLGLSGTEKAYLLAARQRAANMQYFAEEPAESINSRRSARTDEIVKRMADLVRQACELAKQEVPINAEQTQQDITTLSLRGIIGLITKETQGFQRYLYRSEVSAKNWHPQYMSQKAMARLGYITHEGNRWIVRDEIQAVVWRIEFSQTLEEERSHERL